MKVINGNYTKRCVICSNLTIKTREQHHLSRSGALLGILVATSFSSIHLFCKHYMNNTRSGNLKQDTCTPIPDKSFSFKVCLIIIWYGWNFRLSLVILSKVADKRPQVITLGFNVWLPFYLLLCRINRYWLLISHSLFSKNPLYLRFFR